MQHMDLDRIRMDFCHLLCGFEHHFFGFSRKRIDQMNTGFYWCWLQLFDHIENDLRTVAPVEPVHGLVVNALQAQLDPYFFVLCFFGKIGDHFIIETIGSGGNTYSGHIAAFEKGIVQLF